MIISDELEAKLNKYNLSAKGMFNVPQQFDVIIRYLDLENDKRNQKCEESIKRLDEQKDLNKRDADYLRFLRAWIYTLPNNILNTVYMNKRLGDIINKLENIKEND